MEKEVIVFGDTETSGLTVDDRIKQIAFSYKETPNMHYGAFYASPKRFAIEELCNPGIDIDPSAAMTTDIYDKDVRGLKPLTETFAFKKLTAMMQKPNTYFMAYNAPFDVDMFEKDGLIIPENKVIDLYRAAKHLFKDKKFKNRNGEEVPLANNKMQYFRALLKFDEQEDFLKLVRDYGQEVIQSHRALSDVIVMEYFYEYLKKHFNLTFEEVLKLSNQPVLEPYITFGKVFEKGTPFEEVITADYTQGTRTQKGYNYLDWCAQNLTLSVDTEWSIKIHLYHGLIEGKIPYNPDFMRYVNYGLVFEEEPENIKKALELIGKEESFVKTAKKQFVEKLEREVEERVDAELGDRFPPLFLLKYIKQYQLNKTEPPEETIEEEIETQEIDYVEREGEISVEVSPTAEKEEVI